MLLQDPLIWRSLDKCISEVQILNKKIGEMETKIFRFWWRVVVGWRSGVFGWSALGGGRWRRHTPAEEIGGEGTLGRSPEIFGRETLVYRKAQ